MLKYVLLGFLNYEPATGYELENLISTGTTNFWHANLSQIYTTLKKLESAGLVVSHEEEQEGRPNRRVYEITSDGQHELQQWVSTPFTEREKTKNTLMLKLFFGRQAGHNTLLTQLRIQRSIHQAVLDRYRQGLPDTAHEIVSARPELGEDAILWQATLNWGLRYEESLLQWIDETIATIEREFADD